MADTNFGDILGLFAGVGQALYPNSPYARAGGVIAQFVGAQQRRAKMDNTVNAAADMLGIDPRIRSLLDPDDYATLYMIGEKSQQKDEVAQSRYGNSINTFLNSEEGAPYRDIFQGLPPDEQARFLRQYEDKKIDTLGEREQGLDADVLARGRIELEAQRRSEENEREQLRKMEQYNYEHGVPSSESGGGNVQPNPPSWVRPQSSNTNPQHRLMDNLIEQGFSPTVAAGITGSAIQESGVSTNPPGSNDGGASGGMFQWNGARLRALKEDARKKGVPWDDWAHQVDFMLRSPDDAMSRRTLARLRANPNLTVEQAADIFRDGFERPSANDAARRRKHANQVYQSYTANSGGTSRSSSLSGTRVQRSAPSWLRQGADASTDSGDTATTLASSSTSNDSTLSSSEVSDDDDTGTATRSRRRRANSESGTSGGTSYSSGGSTPRQSAPGAAPGQSPEVPSVRAEVVGPKGAAIRAIVRKTQVKRRKKRIYGGGGA